MQTTHKISRRCLWWFTLRGLGMVAAPVAQYTILFFQNHPYWVFQPRRRRHPPRAGRARLELCVTAAQDQLCVRWVVKCPLAGGCHSSPGRKRNRCGAPTSRYGIAEVHGYLGVWPRNAHTWPTQEAHVRGEKPSLSELRGARFRWILLPTPWTKKARQKYIM